MEWERKIERERKTKRARNIERGRCRERDVEWNRERLRGLRNGKGKNQESYWE